jgi:uncharacterized protein
VHYRRLGRTNLQVSVLGVGAGYLSVVDYDLGLALYERAIAAGVNYLDGRYGDSNRKLAPLIKGRRERLVIASKTTDLTAEGGRRRVDEELRALDTDYLDVFQVKAHSPELLKAYLAPGGTVEGLEKARAEGLIHYIGVTGHSYPLVLTDAVLSGRFDTVLFPLNLVQDEAWQTLIPAAQKMDVGMVIMKPLATGLLPMPLALKWLFGQPIATAVPGVSTLVQMEANIAVAEMPDWALTPEDEAEVSAVRGKLAGRVCRGCDERCRPFPVDLKQVGNRISYLIAHDVVYNHLRNLGADGFRRFPWAASDRERMLPQFAVMLELTRKLRAAGLSEVEARCPYGVKLGILLEEQESVLRELLGTAV